MKGRVSEVILETESSGVTLDALGVRACPILRQGSHQPAGLWRQWERRLGQLRRHDR